MSLCKSLRQSSLFQEGPSEGMWRPPLQSAPSNTLHLPEPLPHIRSHSEVLGLNSRRLNFGGVSFQPATPRTPGSCHSAFEPAPPIPGSHGHLAPPGKLGRAPPPCGGPAPEPCGVEGEAGLREAAQAGRQCGRGSPTLRRGPCVGEGRTPPNPAQTLMGPSGTGGRGDPPGRLDPQLWDGWGEAEPVLSLPDHWALSSLLSGASGPPGPSPGGVRRTPGSLGQ